MIKPMLCRARLWRRTLSCFALLFVVVILTASCGTSAIRHKEGDVGYIPTAASPISVKGLTADTYFIYDCEEETFLAIKGAGKRIYPASTTKLLTALYALTLLEPSQTVTPGGEELSLVQAGSSIAYVKENHTLTVEMLIQGMMIPSGNDAAYALAAAGGTMLDETLSGKAAVERFMEGMNAYAKELGCCSSYFTVPDGLAGEEHYTSLEDMAIIVRNAFAEPLIALYGGQASADVVYESGHTNTWVNTNLLLDPQSEYYDPRVQMGKTGSLDGWYNVVFLAEESEERYIIGIFGSSDKEARFADGIQAMNTLWG